MALVYRESQKGKMEIVGCKAGGHSYKRKIRPLVVSLTRRKVYTSPQMVSCLPGAHNRQGFTDGNTVHTGLVQWHLQKPMSLS